MKIYKYNTEQEVFDAVLAHSRKMTEKCIHYGSCRYRGRNGDKCFIGALIEDDEVFEDMLAVNLIRNTEQRSINPELAKFCSEIQNIHDCGFDTREKELELLAQKYKLNYTHIG